jgi:hypothetical protein
MGIAYPVGVPTLVDTGSLDINNQVSIIKSGVDIGKPMSRAKFTGALSDVRWTIRMTSSQVATLLDWYSNTLKKNLKFDFPEPLVGINREYSFITPPEVSHIGADQFNVTYNLRVYV